MARRVTSGFEFQALPTTPTGAAEGEGFLVSASVPAIETTTVRSGAASLKADAQSKFAFWDSLAIANGTAVFARVYLRFSANPAVTTVPIAFDDGAGAQQAHIRLLTVSGNPVLRLRSTAASIGSDLTVATGVWYCVELKVKLASSPLSNNGTIEMRVDGVVAGGRSSTTANLGTAQVQRFLVGNSGTTASQACNIFIDDVAVNDEDATGSNPQTSYPGPGKIVLLKPTADQTRDAGWLDGAGGTSNLYQALDNIPPTGKALALSGATDQIENAANNATDVYAADTQTYAAVGLSTGDVVRISQAIATIANSVGTSRSAGVQQSNNPSGSEKVVSTPATGAGAFPLAWLTVRSDPLYAPSATLASAARVLIRKGTASTDALMACLLGIYVEYTIESSAAVAGAGTVAASGVRTVSGSASVSGGGTVAASGVRTVSGAASVTGAGTVAGSGFKATTGAGSVAGAGTVAASGFKATTGAASVAGAGSVAATGTRSTTATASVSGAGSVAASGTRTALGTASVSGAGSVSATGRLGAFGAGAIAGAGSIAASAGIIKIGAAAINGAGSVSASGTREALGAGSIAGAGSVSATGFKTTTATASVSGAGSITATGFKATSGAGSVSGTGSAAASGVRRASGTASVTGGGTVAASGVRKGIGNATIQGSGLVSATGQREALGSSSVTGGGAVGAGGVVTVTGAVGIIGAGTIRVVIWLGPSDADGGVGVNEGGSAVRLLSESHAAVGGIG